MPISARRRSLPVAHQPSRYRLTCIVAQFPLRRPQPSPSRYELKALIGRKSARTRLMRRNDVPLLLSAARWRRCLKPVQVTDGCTNERITVVFAKPYVARERKPVHLRHVALQTSAGIESCRRAIEADQIESIGGLGYSAPSRRCGHVGLSRNRQLYRWSRLLRTPQKPRHQPRQRRCAARSWQSSRACLHSVLRRRCDGKSARRRCAA